MIRKTRIWISVTLLAVIFFNYLSIGIPLYKRMASLDSKVRVFTKNSEDIYIIDVLKREMITVDRKIVILNCVAVSVAIIILSWMIFGLIVRRPDELPPAGRKGSA
jgi:hypothetical protein